MSALFVRRKYAYDTILQGGPAVLILFGLGCIFFVAADQISKYMIVTSVKPVGSVSVIGDFFRLTYVENRGAAFGMLQEQRWFFMITTAILILVCAVLAARYKQHTWASKTAALLVIAGGIGNLIDRIFRGFVVDFLSFSIFPPVFNLADCCITVGIGFFLIHLLLTEWQQKKANALHEEHEEHEKKENASLEKESKQV